MAAGAIGPGGLYQTVQRVVAVLGGAAETVRLRDQVALHVVGVARGGAIRVGGEGQARVGIVRILGTPALSIHHRHLVARQVVLGGGDVAGRVLGFDQAVAGIVRVGGDLGHAVPDPALGKHIAVIVVGIAGGVALRVFLGEFVALVVVAEGGHIAFGIQASDHVPLDVNDIARHVIQGAFHRQQIADPIVVLGVEVAPGIGGRQFLTSQVIGEAHRVAQFIRLVQLVPAVIEGG